MQVPKLGCDLESRTQRLKTGPVGNNNIDSATFLISEFATRRSELDRHKTNTSHTARIQSRGQLLAIQPRCADNFEGRVGAAPHGNIRRFQKTNSWVEKRLRQTAHVGRWIDPSEACRVPRVGPLPT